MDTTELPTGDASDNRSLVVRTHRERRRMGRLARVALVLAPIAVTAAVGYTQGPALEKALKRDLVAALQAEGLKGVGVKVDGRQVAAQVPTGVDARAVEDVLSGLPGVLTAEATQVYANAREARACEGLQTRLDKATSGQRIPFSGTQPTATGARMLAEVGRLLTACPQGSVTVGGHTDRSTVNGPSISLERAKAMVRILVRAGVEPERMQARGYGDQFPVNTKGTDSGRAQNERGSVTVQVT